MYGRFVRSIQTNAHPPECMLCMHFSVTLYVVACVPFPHINLHLWQMFSAAIQMTKDRASRRALKFIQLYTIVSPWPPPTHFRYLAPPVFMSDVLRIFSDVRITFRYRVAGRAPKIGVERTQGHSDGPHPGLRDSGRIRAGRAGRNPRRSKRDSCTHGHEALWKAYVRDRCAYEALCEKLPRRCGLAGADGHVSQQAQQRPRLIGEMADADGRDLSAYCDSGNYQSWVTADEAQRGNLPSAARSA